MSVNSSNHNYRGLITKVVPLASWDTSNGPTPDFWLLDGLDTEISETWLNNHTYTQYTKSGVEKTITTFTVIDPTDLNNNQSINFTYTTYESVGVGGHQFSRLDKLSNGEFRVVISNGFIESAGTQDAAGRRILYLEDDIPTPPGSSQIIGQNLLQKTDSTVNNISSLGLNNFSNNYSVSSVSTNSSPAFLPTGIETNTSSISFQTAADKNAKEIILYFGTLTTAQSNTVENYLKNKWDINY